VDGHHAQQRRMEGQIGSTRTLAKKIWAQLVAAKIRKQGWVVATAGHRSGAFETLAKAVKAGDPENIEAQAARRYWPLLFGPDFRRDTEAPGANALLNYGYAVLRAATARAIAAAGLHPGIGVFHRHPHNAMPLADDLMEPFRPDVDLEVLALVRDGVVGVEKHAKHRLVAVLSAELPTPLGGSPIQTCLLRLAQSIAASYVSGKISLTLPNIAVYPAQEPIDEREGDRE
jgi:CRISPR-associated protein Cas1